MLGAHQRLALPHPDHPAGLFRATPHPLCSRRCSLPRQQSRPARATPIAAAAAAAAAENSQPAPVVDSRDVAGSDRKPKRKPSPAQQTNVLQEGAAAVAGPLPDVLAATFPATFPTLSAARRVIRKDLILVQGQVGSCKTEVAAGQQLQQLEPVAKSKGPRAVSLQVLYEDDDLAVVHKPWGVKMYGGDGRRTITGALKAGALAPSSSPDALPEPKPLHRLDAAVGGVLLIAKTAAAAADVSLQFVERRVHKVYHALLCGRLEPGADVVTGASPAPFQQQQEERESQAAGVGQLQQGEGQDGASGVVAAGLAEGEPESADGAASADADSESGTATGVSDSEPEDGQATESAQLLPLSELLQRQLQESPPFTVTLQDLADPVLLAADTAEASTGAPVADVSTTTTSISSSSSSGDGSSEAVAGLGPGVHVVELPVDGKPSYSLYQVLGYSRSSRYGGWVTSVALSPVTGRKHQLRRHMAALGCPIVGDGKYALSKEEHISNQGIYLESLEIAFTHPNTEQRLHVSMPEPQRFATMRQQLHNRWRKLSQPTAAASAEQAEGQEASAHAEACANPTPDS